MDLRVTDVGFSVLRLTDILNFKSLIIFCVFNRPYLWKKSYINSVCYLEFSSESGL